MGAAPGRAEVLMGAARGRAEALLGAARASYRDSVIPGPSVVRALTNSSS